MASVDSRDYVLNVIYYSVLEPRCCPKHNVACQHSQQTRDIDPMLVQCWPTICKAGPASNQHNGLVVLTAGGEYKPTPSQCLLNAGPMSSVLGNIHSVLARTSCWRYRHDALNQSWVNVGQPSVTLALSQRGAQHDMVNQYWDNVGSAS